MSGSVYIGDEVSAAGFRLTGIQVHVPQADNLMKLIRTACEQASLVLISAASARDIPANELNALLAGSAPAVVIVPDVHGHIPMPDLVLRARKQLGMLL